MKPDIILAWPRSCDYPLWRQFLRPYRNKFEKVIIVFTETNYGEDYRSFLRDAFSEDDVIAIDSPPVRGDQDWRNVAVNLALQYSTSEWVWFTEQDFLPVSDQFWNEIYYLSKSYQVFGAFAEKRLHPCCIFMHRKLLDETPKKFGVVKDRLDHFGQIQQSLEVRGISIATIRPETYHHMNGLSQNYCLAFNKQPINHNPAEFAQYLKDCLDVLVPQDNRFMAFAKGFLGTNGETPESGGE